jgi:fatty-acyl-CoA synthase
MPEPTFLRLPRLNDYIHHWARERADHAAMIQHEDGKTLSYKQFDTLIDFFALRLLDMGIRHGDRVATQLVLVPEHMALMYACFKIGAIMAPLDVRLQDDEVVRDIDKIAPKAFFFLGESPMRDFRTVGRAVREHCPGVHWLVQFSADPQPGDILTGAVGITRLMDKKRLAWLKLKDLATRRLGSAYADVTPQTPALIIYTTGTTGDPKPALLSHANIIVQNEILARGMHPLPDPRILINLPPSHVGCVTECFMSTMFMGGTTVLLRIFDAGLTLEAIERHRVNALGQIPTQYRMLWRHPEYDRYDLSSLAFVVYGGAAVDTAFLHRISRMAPYFGTGIGMTENAGFGTFTPRGIPIEEIAGQVGRAFPDLAAVTVRGPM